MHVPCIEALDSSSLDEIMMILDEKGARQRIESLNWAKEFPYNPLTSIALAHSSEAIYIDFFVRCNYLRAVNYRNNSPVCEDSCVEFFVSPKCDNHYWNFEFNCIGAVNASHRSERRNPTRLTAAELDQIKRYASCGNKPFEEVEGLFTWDLVVVIPFSLIGEKYSSEPLRMKGNFYKCASGTSQPHYLSWSPIKTEKPDFHRTEFFGDIIFD